MVPPARLELIEPCLSAVLLRLMVSVPLLPCWRYAQMMMWALAADPVEQSSPAGARPWVVGPVVGLVVGLMCLCCRVETGGHCLKGHCVWWSYRGLMILLLAQLAVVVVPPAVLAQILLT